MLEEAKRTVVGESLMYLGLQTTGQVDVSSCYLSFIAASAVVIAATETLHLSFWLLTGIAI